MVDDSLRRTPNLPAPPDEPGQFILYRTEGELDRAATVAECATVQSDGAHQGERDILTRAGAISHDDAMGKAQLEYEKWRTQQAALPSPVEDHFDEAVKKIKRLEHAPRPATSKSRKQRRENRGETGGCHQL